MKKFLMALLVLVSALCLVACGETHEHSWGEGEVTKEATCAAAGEMTYTCECGESKVEAIEKLGHAEYESDKNEHWCAECGEAKAAHTWDEGKVTGQASCSRPGSTKYTCTVCGETKVEVSEKLAHNYSAEWTYNDEQHWHTCICSAVDAKVDHNITYANGRKTANCECGYTIDVAYLTVLHTYAENSVTKTDTIVPELNADGNYVFKFTTPKWGRIELYYDGVKINTENTEFVKATGWIDGVYRGTYPLYWDADSNDNSVFLSAVGGTYEVTYYTEAKEIAIGEDYRVNFTYTGTFEGHPALNEDGVYEIIETFKVWNRITLFYNGVELTTENATFTGAISEGYVNAPKLYYEEGAWIHGGNAAPATFIITYNPETNTVNVEEMVLGSNQLRHKSLNSDAGGDAIAVWEAGQVMKGANGWIGNGWRLFLVVDAEGYIAYMVLFPPNGYGHPSEGSYYSHSSLRTENPAWELVDGGYTVTVPEGGFALTAHGTGVDAILAALGIPGAAEAQINNANALSDDVRVSYTSQYGGVITFTVPAAE